jgi:4-amino-4-deoxy-L-arabinose transferase-like glycosyltransferase
MRPGFWFLLAITSAIAITNLGGARLWDRDEPRNAQCAREMMEADNYVVPTFDGQLRTHKPILIYWLQIAAYKTFGVTEFAARLPSALAGILTVFLVYWMAGRLASPEVATWAGICLGTMLLFVMAQRAATPDALLIATSTLAIALFTRFAFRPTRQDSDASGFPNLQFNWPSLWQWGAVYAACGLAVLAKGPVGLVLPVAVMGMTILLVHREVPATDRSNDSPETNATVAWIKGTAKALVTLIVRVPRTAWRMRPLLALAVVLCVAGPWYFAVGWATEGEWLREFFLTHNVSRAVQPMEGHTGPPVLFYLGALLVGTFPWSCFAIPVLLAVRNRWQTQRARSEGVDPLLALALSWIAVYVGCFSIASTKLPSYVTPCHPGVALIVGWYVSSVIADRVVHPRWMRAGLSVGFIVGLGTFVIIGGPVATIVPTVRPLAIAGMVMAVASVIGIALAVRKYEGLAMRSFAIGGISFVWLLHGFGPKLVDRGRSDLDLLQSRFAASPNESWWIDGSPEPSWVFYSNGRIRSGRQDEHAIEPNPEIVIDDSQSTGAVPIFLDDQYLRVVEVEPTRVAGRRR